MFHQKTFTVEAIHVDCFGRMTPAAILYCAQEAAGSHCLQLGTDYDTLSKKGLFWAVTRHTAQVQQLPCLGQTVTVKTWPMPTTRVAYPRATEILDADGNVLVQVMSLWVLMDAEKRTMVLPGKSGVEVPGVATGNEIDAPRSLAPRQRTNSCNRKVAFSLLDRNGHMNNTHYLTWAADLLESGHHKAHAARQFTVCYLNEAREGQDIRLDWEQEGDVLSVDAYRANLNAGDERVFSVQITY